MKKLNQVKIKNKSIILGTILLLLIMLTLLGVTYGYYRIKVIGNKEEYSVNIVGKKLKIEYLDNNEVIKQENITPGFSSSKNFSVTNTGDEAATYGIKIENVDNTFIRKEDWTYKIYKLESENDKNITEDKLMRSGTLPNTDSWLIYKENIEVNKTNYYQLKIEYINSVDNQNVDIGKTLKFKINIDKEVGENFLNAKEGTLLEAIGKDNAISETLTTSRESSTENEAELGYVEDDYGMSYYYRGNVQNNYVTFGGMCWRIVRVLGNGNIKLVLASEKGPCIKDNITETSAFINNAEKFKYSNETALKLESVMYEKSILKEQLEKWYTDKFEGQTSTETNNIVESEWCNDYRLMGETLAGEGTPYEGFGEGWITSESKYPSPLNLKCGQGSPSETHSSYFNPSNVGPGEAKLVKSKIGALTYLEVRFAGQDDTAWLNVQDNLKNGAWTMSPAAYFSGTPRGLYMQVLVGGKASSYSNRGINAEGHIDKSWSARPSIVLSSTVSINSGNGTLDSPYIID